MRLYVVRQSEPLAPFERVSDDCGLGGGTFRAYRERTARKLKLELHEATLEQPLEGPALVVSDDVFVTRRALRGFLRASVRAGRPARLCLPPSRLLELFLPLQDLDMDAGPGELGGRAAFDVAFVPQGERASAAELFALDAARWLAPPYREILLEVPLPRHLLGVSDERFTFPLTSTVALRVRHWVHVLRAGHLMPQIELLERAEDQPLRSFARAALALRLSKAATRRALQARFSYRGRGCFVHPSATVEASVLGDGVRVGAYAYVVGSVLGDGVVVEQRAHVEQSCLGPRTFVSKNSSVSACVAFGDTDVCVNGIQTCAVAERCGLTSWARPLDTIPGAHVHVKDGDELRDVGALPCGVAFGTDVFVGAGVDIAPGRMIPAGLKLVGDPARTLLKAPDAVAPGTVAYVDEGAVKPTRPR